MPRMWHRYSKHRVWVHTPQTHLLGVAVVTQVWAWTVGAESQDKSSPSKAFRVRTMRKRPWNLYLSNPQIYANGQTYCAASQGTDRPHWCIWDRRYRQKQNTENRYILPLCWVCGDSRGISKDSHQIRHPQRRCSGVSDRATSGINKKAGKSPAQYIKPYQNIKNRVFISEIPYEYSIWCWCPDLNRYGVATEGF